MNPNIAKNIKSLREAQKMTQADLADRVGVTGATISTYEVGTRMPSYEVLISLAQIFHVSTDNLLGFSNRNVLDVSRLTIPQRNTIQDLIDLYEIKNERNIQAASERNLTPRMIAIGELNEFEIDKYKKQQGLE